MTYDGNRRSNQRPGKILDGPLKDLTILSKSDELAVASIAFARQFAELTGETPSRLHAWGLKHGDIAPLMRSRQAFYTAMAKGGWSPKSRPAETCDCRLGSFPFYCELRLRLISLETQFRADVRSKIRRRLVLLWGYEMCSGLLHFRVFRGQALEPGETDDGEARVSAEIVSDFVFEMARMVGLPIRAVYATNDLVSLPGSPLEAYWVSLEGRTLIDRQTHASMGPDRPCLISFQRDVDSDLKSHPVDHFGPDHPLSLLCRSTSAKELVDQLADWVKAHNVQFALPRLKDGRKALKVRHEDALARAEGRVSAETVKAWGMPKTEFLKRMEAATYLKNAMSLHDVRYFKRAYQDFTLVPGDM